MNIVLIGYRASGKSTIGRLLAEELGLAFVDIDDQIRSRYGNKSVAEIWDAYGEPDYRETECDVTEMACRKDQQVIALGGGTPMQSRAFDALASLPGGLRFYLQAPAEILHQRSNRDTSNITNRPSLTRMQDGLAEVQHMLSLREPTYRRLADHTIDVAQQSMAQAARQIAEIARSG